MQKVITHLTLAIFENGKQFYFYTVCDATSGFENGLVSQAVS
jgi:hypothetical protein